MFAHWLDGQALHDPFFFSEPDTMTVLTNNLEAYHIHLIQHLAKLEGTVTLCSGTQQITVQAFLLRNSSQFLKKTRLSCFDVKTHRFLFVS